MDGHEHAYACVADPDTKGRPSGAIECWDGVRAGGLKRLPMQSQSFY